MHRITSLACVLFAATVVAQGADCAAAADLLPLAADPGADSAAATPNHDPYHLSLAEMGAVATPNHDPHHPTLTDLAILRAEPEAALPAAPSFAAVETMLYAKANARLRAGPSITAGVVAKLAADAPLHAVARSKDGTWWKVSLADKRTGYVHRDAVTASRIAKAEPPVTLTPPPVAAASLPPVSLRRSQSLLGFVDEATNWFVDVAARGSPRKVIRTER